LLTAQLLLALAAMLLLLSCLAAIVAVQAQRRGYNFLVWFFAGLLGNAIFFLVLLAIMPDYARKRLRRKETEELEGKLDARADRAVRAAPPAERAFPDVSLGDRPTELPSERSLGDEETRL
jgi:hypothetical protein